MKTKMIRYAVKFSLIFINHYIVLAVIFSLILASCDDSSTDPQKDDGVRFFEFAMRGRGVEQNFIAQTSDPQILSLVDTLLALPEEERNMFILGNIAPSNGGHNFDWNWHFVPDEWQLVEAAVEVCDGNPLMVEDGLDYWLEHLGYFCPWGLFIVREVETK